MGYAIALLHLPAGFAYKAPSATDPGRGLNGSVGVSHEGHEGPSPGVPALEELLRRLFRASRRLRAGEP
jgi:hypothetical protein